MPAAATVLQAVKWTGALAKGATDTATISYSANSLICVVTNNVPAVYETPSVPAISFSNGLSVTLSKTQVSASNLRTSLHTAVATSAGSSVTVTVTEPSTGSTDGSGTFKWAVFVINGGASPGSLIDIATSGSLSAGPNSITAAGGPAAQGNELVVAIIGTRAYGATTAQSAPTGWTEMTKHILTNGTSNQLLIAKRDAVLDSGSSVSQAFAWTADGTDTANYILVTFKSVTLRAKCEFLAVNAGTHPAVGATDTLFYLWDEGGPTGGAATAYEDVTISDGGSHKAVAYLDVSALGLNVGDTPYWMVQQGTETASPNNVGTTGGIFTATVEEGAGAAPV